MNDETKPRNKYVEKTIEQKIAAAKDTLAALEKAAKEAQAKRIDQQKYLLGSFVMATLGTTERMAAFTIGDKRFADFLTRPKDRSHFGIK